MDLSGAFNAQLSELTDALQDPGTDLSAILDVLVDDLTAAIPSFLGLRLTLQMHGRPFTLTLIEDTEADTARASLRLPLNPLAVAGPGSAVILLAANPGAFVHLAADGERVWGVAGQVQLDQHLGVHADRHLSSTDELHQFSDINRAIGVLLTQELTPGQARQHLQQVAVAQRVTESTAAARIVHARTCAELTARTHE